MQSVSLLWPAPESVHTAWRYMKRLTRSLPAVMIPCSSTVLSAPKSSAHASMKVLRPFQVYLGNPSPALKKAEYAPWVCFVRPQSTPESWPPPASQGAGGMLRLACLGASAIPARKMIDMLPLFAQAMPYISCRMQANSCFVRENNQTVGILDPNVVLYSKHVAEEQSRPAHDHAYSRAARKQMRTHLHVEDCAVLSVGIGFGFRGGPGP